MRDWHGQQEPLLADTREQIIDPRTAYQIVSMLEGVVQRGTGRLGRARSASRWPARPAPRRTPRTPGSSASRPIWPRGVYRRLRQSAHPGPHRAGRHRGRADLPRLHEGRAGRRAAHAVPRRARHRGSADRLEERHARCRRARPARSWKPSRPAPRPARPMRPHRDRHRRRCGDGGSHRPAGSRTAARGTVGISVRVRAGFIDPADQDKARRRHSRRGHAARTD